MIIYKFSMDFGKLNDALLLANHRNHRNSNKLLFARRHLFVNDNIIVHFSLYLLFVVVALLANFYAKALCNDYEKAHLCNAQIIFIQC